MKRTLTLAAVLLLACSHAAAETIDAGDGVRLWYKSAGNRKGSPIIVIHGGPGMDYNSLAADLKPLEKTHRLIYYDQRGGVMIDQYSRQTAVTSVDDSNAFCSSSPRLRWSSVSRVINDAPYSSKNFPFNGGMGERKIIRSTRSG